MHPRGSEPQIELWMRAYFLVPHLAHEKHADEITNTLRVRQFLMKALGSNAILGLVVDMGMIRRALRGH
jgi:hypothetical protein